MNSKCLKKTLVKNFTIRQFEFRNPTKQSLLLAD